MADCMTFPDTVEEYMDNYKIVDTEQVYTNGAELVPIFRMKQWFEHLQSAQPEIVRCKDCKHSQGEGYPHCNYVTWWNTEDDFCSRAEMKEG